MNEPTPALAGVKGQPVWQSRTTQALHPLLAALGNSTMDDAAFAQDDLAGSIAHVAGLHHVALLDQEEAILLIQGLQELHRELETDAWKLDPALEDIHMNIEAALKARHGDVADKLHTGRSRNDQVATAITLHARRKLFELIQNLCGLEERLLQAAKNHLTTSWTATTHGQAAQPATIGYLLVAHAVRTGRAIDPLITVLQALDECPLGAGAVAGSTLPLQTEVPAALLGLKPLENALVASGTRDNVLAALGATTHIAPVLSALATDLLKLHEQGQYTPPQNLTTGSSLMPQKRNPDALELARAYAHALPVHQQKVHQLLLGLGLGYQRDLQLTKPPLVAAFHEANTTTAILTAHIETDCFHSSKIPQSPAIAATDVVETLVENGTPFRTAYHWVAQAAAHHEQQNTPLPDALDMILLQNGVLEKTRTACKDNWAPDAQRRTTRGAPAAERVGESIARLTQDREKRLKRLDPLTRKLEQPASLLSKAPASILIENQHPPQTIKPEPEPSP